MGQTRVWVTALWMLARGGGEGGRGELELELELERRGEVAGR